LGVLDELVRFHHELGLGGERLAGRDCRAREPMLHPRIRGGAWVAADHQVDNRRLVTALATAAEDYLYDVRMAQNLVVLRTAPGTANSLAVAIDSEPLTEVVGTVAGDDTVLVITESSADAQKFRQRMLERFGFGPSPSESKGQ